MNDSNFYTTLPGGNFILLPSAKLKMMKEYRQNNKHSPEAGGLIIGVLRQTTKTTIAVDNPPHMEIMAISTPGIGDKRSRYGFERRGNHHLQLVSSFRQLQNNMADYLGEWHTHPEPHPTPSNIDCYYWKKNLKNRLAVLIIIGTETEWIGYWNGQYAIELPALTEEVVNEKT